MADLHAAGCDLLTITQYLRPSPRHHPVDRWVPPEEFDELAEEAAEVGFAGRSVRAARPLVLPGRAAVPPGHGTAIATGILAIMVKKSGGTSELNPAIPPRWGASSRSGIVAKIIRKANPKALPLVALIGVGILAVFVLVGLLIGLLYLFIPLGIIFGSIGAMVAFGRFAQSAQYSAIEGQPGAAAAILQNLRGGFTTTPAIAANRNMDVVHRTVGKPGVILVGEGSPNGLRSLLAAEKKRISRVANQVPIYDFMVGDGDGQVPIRGLQKKIMKLPRNLKGPAVADLNIKLNALPQQLQMPKGPVPRNARMPRPPRPRTR